MDTGFYVIWEALAFVLPIICQQYNPKQMKPFKMQSWHLVAAFYAVIVIAGLVYRLLKN
jgi:hypothetical protein